MLKNTLAVGAAVAALALGPLALPTATPALAQAVDKEDLQDANQIVDRARLTIQEAKSDPCFGTAPQLLQRARAVLIVPNLVKGGLIVGGQGGQGVLLARGQKGWNGPVFYTMAGGSVGLQIGIQEAEVVVFVMSDEALQALLDDNFSFGGQASLAIATIGSNVGASSSTALDADMIIWAQADGAYAGLTLEGTGLDYANDLNMAYYGERVQPMTILKGSTQSSSKATALKQELR